MNQSRAAPAAIAVVIPLAMVATAYTGRPPQVSQEHEKITVVASFYPLYEFASRVGGDRADVSSLVPAGIEPHDWEPTLQDKLRVQSANMLVINGVGFESWADNMGASVVVDTSVGSELEHEGEIEEDGQGHEGGVNPHIWLDPVLAKHQVEKIRDALAMADLENTNYYAQNAAEFTVELDQLDAFIRLELGINVVYSEDLIDSRLADTIAGEIPGGRVLVLSPIEGIDQEDRALGIAYIEKMKQNVETLKAGLECTY